MRGYRNSIKNSRKEDLLEKQKRNRNKKKRRINSFKAENYRNEKENKRIHYRDILR